MNAKTATLSCILGDEAIHHQTIKLKGYKFDLYGGLMIILCR